MILPSRIALAGRDVTRVGLGTMHLIGPSAFGPPASRQCAIDVLRTALLRGVRLFDTADAYGPGFAECLVAEALHPYPAEIVVATKGGLERRSRDEWLPNGRPAYLRGACETSLRNLDLDAIPLYQLHVVDPHVPVEDSVGTLAELRAEGKIEHIGLCNVSLSQLLRAQSVAPIASVQNCFNQSQCTDRTVLHYCERHSVPFIAWGPFAGGRALRSAPDAKHGSTAVSVLRWLMAQSKVLVAIPGAATVEELEQNSDPGIYE